LYDERTPLEAETLASIKSAFDAANAHYHMLQPDRSSVKVDDSVTIVEES